MVGSALPGGEGAGEGAGLGKQMRFIFFKKQKNEEGSSLCPWDQWLQSRNQSASPPWKTKPGSPSSVGGGATHSSSSREGEASVRAGPQRPVYSRGKLRRGGVTDPGVELRRVAPSAGFQIKLDLMSNISCTICLASLCDWFVQRGRRFFRSSVFLFFLSSFFII